MATQVPAKLKQADVQRFVHRAAQLDKYKPAIAYWCRYQALNNILSKGLQSADNECLEFATQLMDKVEEMKTTHADDPAILDEALATPSIQRFGLETFERADKAIRSNSVTAQTVDTFQAAVTFLDLLSIWQPVPADVISKIKYAKFHAVRIARALKAGEDPNLSNPVQEPEPPQDPGQIQLDPNDPEVQAINAPALYQPTVEDAREEDGLPSPFPQRSPGGTRPISTGAASPPPTVTQVGRAPVSPEAPSPTVSNPRANSVGGGYFPESDPSIPSAPARLPGAPQDPSTLSPGGAPPWQPSAPPAASPSDPSAFYQTHVPRAPLAPSPQPPSSAPHAQLPPSMPNSMHSTASSLPAPPPGPRGFTDDDAAVAEAQKHAKWAISALNFEDVPTAVKELSLALRSLGAN